LERTEVQNEGFIVFEHLPDFLWRTQHLACFVAQLYKGNDKGSRYAKPGSEKRKKDNSITIAKQGVRPPRVAASQFDSNLGSAIKLILGKPR
jgi:hypothetical protein